MSDRISEITPTIIDHKSTPNHTKKRAIIANPATTAEHYDTKPNVLVLFGQHQKAEVIAHEVGRTLQQVTALNLDYKLLFHQHSDGLCYTDAYVAAKKKAQQMNISLDDPRLGELYYTEVARTQREGFNKAVTFATSHPKTPVLDLHETPLRTDGKRDLLPEDITFLSSLPHQVIKKINARIQSAIPATQRSADFLTIQVRHIDDSISHDPDNVIPPNYLAIELHTATDLYESLPVKDKAFGVPSLDWDQLLALKNSTDPVQQVRITTELHRQVTKYSFLLERVLPVVIDEVSAYLALQPNNNTSTV